MEQFSDTSSDQLNFAALPTTRGMELDWRLPLAPGASRDTYRGLLVTIVWGAVLTIVIRLFGGYLDSPYVLALLTFASVGYGLDAHVRRRVPGANAAVLAAAGPLVWLLAWSLSAQAIFVVFFAALVGMLVLCHAITDHAARWMHANPAIDPTTRRWLLQQWGREASAAHLDPARIAEIRKLEPSERAALLAYRRGYIYVVAAALVSAAVYPMVKTPLFAGMAVFLVFGLLLAAIGGFGPGGTTSPALPGWRQSLTLCWSAVVNWMRYNARDVRAPGVFQSPAGPVGVRIKLTLAVVLALTLSMLPAASYFPVAMLASKPGTWLGVEYEPWPWERGGWLLPGDPVSASPTELTDEQRAYAQRLSPTARRAFTHSLSVPAARVSDGERARLYANITSSPERWFLFAIRGATAGGAVFVWTLLGSLVLSLLAPAMLAGLVLFAVAGRRLMHLYATLEMPGAAYHSEELAANPWQAMVMRLRTSAFVATDPTGRAVSERDHLFVGQSLKEGYPVLLSTAVLNEHAHITGDTGSGKTSLGLTPMMVQLIERRDPSVLVIDLKGDAAMFQAARHAAQESGLRFRWFTNVADRSTFLFNPFTQRHIVNLPRTMRAELLLQSLGLDYGEGYGTHYFSSVHREVLTKVLEARPEVDTFAKLARQFERKQLALLADEIQAKQRDDATHLYAVVNSLASIPALNYEPGSGQVHDSRIDLSDLRREPEVVYFNLPAMLDSSAVRQIAKLALYCLLTAAARTPGRQVYVFIDEFQQVVSENLEIVLRQARSMGVSCILANQTLSDLRTASANLIPTVQANTRFKQAFSATDLQQQRAMVDASGETVRYFATEMYGGRDLRLSSISYRETFIPRLRRNDIIGASDNPHLSYMHVTRGDGFSQFGGFPFLIRSWFHIDSETYKRRMRERWPSAEDGAFIPQGEEARRPADPKLLPAETKAGPGDAKSPRRRMPRCPDDLGDRLDAL